MDERDPRTEAAQKLAQALLQLIAAPAPPPVPEVPVREWYTTEQAAEYLGTTKGALLWHVRKGNLVPDRRGGQGRLRTHRFRKATLDAFGS